eukprot:7912996-Lingulodinium_polyedra.AAC.1
MSRATTALRPKWEAKWQRVALHVEEEGRPLWGWLRRGRLGQAPLEALALQSCEGEPQSLE